MSNVFQRAPVLLLATMLLLAACQTADRGSSTVSSTDKATEPVANKSDEDERAGPADKQDSSGEAEGLEHDFNRPGSDYRDVALDTADPAICKEMCEDQMRCMAFTYVRPGVQGEKAKCWLKHSVPDKVEDDCCVSGVNPRADRRRTQLESSGFELNTDRPGSDFRNFAMDQPDPAKCQEACANLRECQAFTYVRPGYQGEKAKCWLKNAVPDKRTGKDCCISGVK